MTCFVASVEENLKGFRRNVQHKKCSLACLVWTYKFSESLAKDKIDIMLEDFGLTSVHLGRFLAHVMLAVHMHLDQGNHEDSSLIAFNLIGIGEASRE